MTFKELGLKSEVLKSIEQLGFSTPTPIQEQAIPHLLGVHSDFVGLAQTGTGKTAAFGLPLINNINLDENRPQGLVICPTRELCLQISKDIESYSKFLDCRTVAVYGGTDIRKQITDIKRGAHVIVATPGRLMDLVKRKAIQLQHIDYVILDEADEMLNMGFKEDIDLILEQTPPTKNVWLFSATMPKEVARISQSYQTDPLEVSIGHKNQTNENIDHIYYSVMERDRYGAVKRLIDFNPDIYGLIFCRTRHETATVAEKLSREGYNAEPLHGDLSQAQRDRVMDRFRNKDLQILVATDVAARGLDIDDITHVINYNLPDDIENYTHRSGRTARAGKKGESLVLINTRENGKIRSIEKQMRMEFTKGTIPGPEDICAIQLTKLMDKILKTEVNEKEIEAFLPQIYASFEDMSKEDLIQKFVSTEFNRFFDYYQKAGDLNASSNRKSGRDEGFSERGGRGDRRDRGERSDRGERKGGRDRQEEGKTRFFVSLGKRDGLNPGGLLRTICDATGLKSDSIGRIDITPSFSFFEADDANVKSILDSVNGAEFEGTQMNVEITKSGGGERSSGGGGDRRSSGGGGFKGGGARRGTYGGDRERSGGGGFKGRSDRSSSDRPERSERSERSDRPERSERSGSSDRREGGFSRRSESSGSGEKRGFGAKRDSDPGSRRRRN
jgi:ATP-dependent RNA helicase DeaD